MKNALRIFAFFYAIILSSCSLFEEEDLISSDYFKANGKLKVWKLKTYDLNGESLLTECINDDTFTFNQETGEYIWAKNKIKCFEGEKDDYFTYAWSEDKKALLINGNNFQIIELNHSNFILKMENSGHIFDLWFVPA